MEERFPQDIQKVAEKFVEVAKLVHQWQEFKALEDATSSLLHDAEKEDICGNTLDPRFNSISWARDVDWLIDQIYFSYYWMDAFAKYFEEKHGSSRGTYGDYWPTSFYADNCIVGIHSCRDKMALMVWAFYCPFDIRKKEEILDFHGVIKRLRHPVKYAIEVEGSEEFYNPLNGLNDSVFRDISEYRHKKIHRREPKIIMGDIQNFHNRDYIFPVNDPNELEGWKNEMKSLSYDSEMIALILKNSVFDGVRYRSKRVDELLISYSNVHKQVDHAFKKILKVATACFNILNSRLFPR